jgi:uncharacterized protein with von Willebrand factor type A (vWA) domain
MITGSISRLGEFSRALRNRGMTVTPDQVAEMATALTLIDLTRRDQVYAALRALAITDPSHRAPYDEEFRRFFEAGGFDAPAGAPSQGRGRERASIQVLDAPTEEGNGERVEETGASAIERISNRDFADLDPDQLAEARHLVQTMLWVPSDFRTRRWSADESGRRPDLRRTLTGTIGPAGDLMRIQMRKRTTKRRPLIVIADISGSMERYTDMFLVFAHAAQRRLGEVEVFTFSTRLTRITEELRRKEVDSALARVTRSVSDWSGGTKIGEALATWNRQWSRRLARGGPVALVLSDGWDCGDPQLLSTEMARLARSVHRVIWLNPLAGRDGFEPTTRGMRAVMPHVDRLLPAATLSDLGEVVRLLESIGSLP